MISFVILAVSLSNGQVTDYKPVDEFLYRTQAVCEQHIPEALENFPQYKSNDFKLVCAEVERPEIK